ncbi:MAG: Fe-S cluster assembly protein SufD [Candidatus Marinimicrobia bacterium]|nr:Fe-S cluster assembly protein SufD [Candidatus Neomarinimicrobiota bacterium]
MPKPTDTSKILKHYEHEFQRLYGNSNGSLTILRRTAMDKFLTTGLPTPKQEDWRSTNLNSIMQAYPVASPKAELTYFDDLDFEYISNLPRIVFVNGYYTAELSDLSNLPEQMRVNSLTYLLKTDPEKLTRRLKQYPSDDVSVFTSLNTALFNSGTWIEIPDNLPESFTLQLINITKPTAEQQSYQLRNFIDIGENSQFNLIEQNIGLGTETYFNNIVTDLRAGRNATIKYTRIQNEAETGNHISSTLITQAADSQVESMVVSLGGQLIRNDLEFKLEGAGATGNLNGLYLARGNQLIDNHTVIDHTHPECSSNELYKGILDDDSHAVFNGKIIVQPDAQKTDARQINRNLLLSEKARVNTNPQLEIYADDVKCAHGSTIGQLDSDALFYLRSRGITARVAQTLMIEGFAKEVLETIADETTRALITNMVNDWFVNGNNGDDS